MVNLVKAARARFYGRRTVALPPAKVRRNVRLGPGREDEWPQSAAETNPVAAELTRRAGSA